MQRKTKAPGSLDAQQRKTNSLKVGSSEQKPSSGAFQEGLIDSKEAVLGFCSELPGRGACPPLRVARAFVVGTQQSLAGDQVEMSFMDHSVLQLLHLHSCQLLSLRNRCKPCAKGGGGGRGGGGGGGLHFLLIRIYQGCWRCLTSVLRHS